MPYPCYNLKYSFFHYCLNYRMKSVRKLKKMKFRGVCGHQLLMSKTSSFMLHSQLWTESLSLMCSPKKLFRYEWSCFWRWSFKKKYFLLCNSSPGGLYITIWLSLLIYFITWISGNVCIFCKVSFHSAAWA